MTREQFITLVEGEQKGLRRFLLALCCGNAQAADDIAQESLIKAYLAIDQYRDDGRFGEWLYRIAHNTFLDMRRTERYDANLCEATTIADNTTQADAQYQYQDLHVALSTLPPKERTAVLLFYLNGYNIKEIADIVNCSADAVKKQLQRGRDLLRTKLER